MKNRDPHKHKTSLVDLAGVHTFIFFLGDCFTHYSSSMPLSHTSLFHPHVQPVSFLLSFLFYSLALTHKGAICWFSMNSLLPGPIRSATLKIASYWLLIGREKRPRFHHRSCASGDLPHLQVGRSLAAWSQKLSLPCSAARWSHPKDRAPSMCPAPGVVFHLMYNTC